MCPFLLTIKAVRQIKLYFQLCFPLCLRFSMKYFPKQKSQTVYSKVCIRGERISLKVHNINVLTERKLQIIAMIGIWWILVWIFLSAWEITWG